MSRLQRSLQENVESLRFRDIKEVLLETIIIPGLPQVLNRALRSGKARAGGPPNVARIGSVIINLICDMLYNCID